MTVFGHIIAQTRCLDIVSLILDTDEVVAVSTALRPLVRWAIKKSSGVSGPLGTQADQVIRG